ncbi:MAG: glycerate kinase [Pirellula sp.]|nr:glycerate kinase [Pirellula sp.]
MLRTPEQLRADALRIWRAGLDAVRSPQLIFDAVEVEGSTLRLGDEFFDLNAIDRIGVVGGGKAAAGMAVALEQALGPRILRAKHVHGLVNVPADCLQPTDAIRLHAGRPAGVNEPTSEGVAGVREMLRIVAELGPRDLCICLISGGGSALLPAPIDGFALEDKVALTREMSARGATIEQMNAVRRALSRVKGGGLAAACRAGRLVALILSDVPGDDLAAISSGPTMLGAAKPRAAMEVIEALSLAAIPAGANAQALLRERMAADGEQEPAANPFGCEISNLLIGNNATAVDGAGVEAERLGYSHAMVSANAPEGLVEEVAAGIVTMARRMRDEPGPDCLISGGEPTVRLAPAAERGRGGRNQQLCLAALAELADWRRLCLLSGGTDGEDGPTDAAGACVDELIAAEVQRLHLDPRPSLARNDAYTFFDAVGGLLRTGPTHTNVCDLRVLTVSRAD